MATLSRQDWPHDPGELDAFYGNPRGPGGKADPAWEAANLVDITFPWKLKGGQQTWKIHKRCLAAVDLALQTAWDHVGHDQAKIAAAHLDEFGGSYVYRANRNDASKLSNHSYGIALDFAPDENPNRSAWKDDGTMLPKWFIEIWKTLGFRWGGDFTTTKDAMHFEAVFDQHHDQPPVPALLTLPAPTGPVTPQKPLPSVPPGVTVPGGIETVAADLLASFTRAIRSLAQQNVLAELRKLEAEVMAWTEPVPVLPPPPVVVPVPPVTPTPTPQPAARLFTGITATVFGGKADRNTSAYDGHLIDDDEFGVALPMRFSKPTPLVEVSPAGKNEWTKAATVDVGPWNTADNYPLTGARPQAESGTDMAGRKTNRAGIDLTPALAKKVGIDGKGLVDWRFVT